MDIKQHKDLSHGYFYFMDRNHPLASAIGKVYVHRHVASIKIGRLLREGEVVHHIDGNVENNDPSNLEVMSNIDHSKLHKPIIYNVTCSLCSKVFKPESNKQIASRFCSQLCWHKYNQSFEVSKEELTRLVWEIPTTKIAEKFKVSDKAIEKRCKKLGINKPPRGYWAKKKANEVLV